MASVTNAKDWKSSVSKGAELQLPSGNTCLVRAPGMQVFIANGMVPNDLLGVVESAISGGQGNDSEALKKVMNDLQKKAGGNLQEMLRMMRMMDEIVMHCVVEPSVEDNVNAQGAALLPSQRDDDKLYIDEVDAEDKNFIFQFVVGGTRDLVKFREQQAAAMASLHSVQESESPALGAS